MIWTSDHEAQRTC